MQLIFLQYSAITSEMESVYSQAKVTLPDGSVVPLDPGKIQK